MLILPIEDFKEEVKAEMYGYEEISEQLISRWFTAFDAYVSSKKKDERIQKKGSTVDIKLKDESDLFMVVDKYLAAVMNEELEAYFSDFKF